MNGRMHKLLGVILFLIFYYLKLFPAIVNDYLLNPWGLIFAFIIVFFISGGRLKSRSFWDFGLSPDNDYHKKMQRDWLMHSAIIPTILFVLLSHPLIGILGFFYTFHVALDLLNTHSWDGNKYTYIAVFITVILFYVLFYS